MGATCRYIPTLTSSKNLRLNLCFSELFRRLPSSFFVFFLLFTLNCWRTPVLSLPLFLHLKFLCLPRFFLLSSPCSDHHHLHVLFIALVTVIVALFLLVFLLLPLFLLRGLL